jgi:glycerophosphoryl diester phosphodiesterase
LTKSAAGVRIANMARPFLIQGHRGAMGLVPENTLPSFRAAIDAGANSLETDVHLTADGVPVLTHDPIIPGTDTPVHRLTAEQACGPYGIPTLADLYRLVAGHSDVIVDVEIKRVPFRAAELGQTAGVVEQAVLDVIRAAGAVGRTWVRSFDHRCVRRLREMESGLTGVVLISDTAPVDPVVLVRAADAQVYGPDYRSLDEDQVRQCHAAGVRVVPWTVNEPAAWERLVGWGVDGITTDYPDRLAKWLQYR